jgi:hypothetical protein
MTSPGSSVIVRDAKATTVATSKIISAVVESCHVSPLTDDHRRRAWGSSISSVVTTTGPIGAKPSEPLARSHWRSSRCRSRMVMSLRIVYPKITSRASARPMRDARRPITAASSHSRSSISVAIGRTTVPCGSATAFANLLNSIGYGGGSIDCSRQWSW